MDIPPRAQDINNLIQKLQGIELNGNAPVDALLKTINKQGWVHEHKCNNTRRLTRLFIASKECLVFAKKNPDILIIDATYSTNRFEMPLLDIISIYFFYIFILL
jgi:ABC-type Fe2+-enterobactin transport system substrate-binding protein